MQNFQKAMDLAKRVEGFGLEIRFIESGWRIQKGSKLIIYGNDLDRLQYFVEGMGYGSTDKTEDVEEGGPGEPLFVEGTDDELAARVNQMERDIVKTEKERDSWKKRYNRLRSRVRRSEKKVWLAICPTDYSHAVVTVGATRHAASEAMMYTLDSNEDVERVYFEQQDVEPEREAQVAKKKKATSKKKRRK